jgi:hypothetical protein
VPCRRLVAAAALLFLVAGCAEKTQGSPAPEGEQATSTPRQTTEQTTGETTTEEPAEEGIAGIEPCDLLDQSELAGLQLTGGESKTVGGARVCRWQRDGATVNELFTVSVELFDDQGLDDLNAPDVQQLPPVGGHEAVRFTDPTGTCGVGLGVGESSRVDNTAVGGDQQVACQLAEQLATIIETKLP